VAPRRYRLLSPLHDARLRHCPTEALIWRELDGELVVRNARTGSTHLLDPFAAAVLRALIHADPDPFERLDRSKVEAVLNEFERLGLVETGPL
jgi:hypothetical protein